MDTKPLVQSPKPSVLEKGSLPPGGPPGPPGGWLFTQMSKQQEILFNIMIPCLQLIAQSTLTTVFPVSRHIAQSFDIQDPSVLPWVVAAYATSFGTFILIGGRLGDIFGHKPMVILGYSWLSFWSVVVGLSRYGGYQLFFIARAFQGMGAAMMVPNGLAMLGRTYPPGSKQKVIAFAIFGLCAPVGAYTGMAFGALFTEYAGWWWSFFTLAIITCLLAITVHFVVIDAPPNPKQLRPIKDKLRDMDWLGALLGVSGLVCVQVALVSAPSAGWKTQFIYMLLIIGLLLVAFFVITEMKIAQQPLVPFKMIKPDVSLVLGAVSCGWATFGVWTWFMWKYMMVVQEHQPLQAALRVIPILFMAFIAAAITAVMMRKCHASWVLFWALVAFTFGPLLLALDSNIQNTSYWTWTFFSLLIMPFGMDMSFPASTMIMSNNFPPHMQGVAGSLIATVVNYSISLGLGIASTVEMHTNNAGQDIMTGIRSAWFTGVGLGGLGVVICTAFVVKSTLYPQSPSPSGPPTSRPAASQLPHRGPIEKSTISKPRSVSMSSLRSDSTASTLSHASTVTPSTPRAARRARKDSVTAQVLENYEFPATTELSGDNPHNRGHQRSSSSESPRMPTEWREGPLSVKASPASHSGRKHKRTYSSNETSPPVPALPAMLEPTYKGPGSGRRGEATDWSYGEGYAGIYGGVQPRRAGENRI